MKTVTIRCEHSTVDLHLRISESNLCFIQCGLVQIVLSRAQAARVRRHCHCMPDKLQYEREQDMGRAIMTIDPSHLDLRGEFISSLSFG